MEIIKKNNTIFISGVIDEHSDFKTLGDLSPGTTINGNGVSKINSNGVKSWITYFTDQKAKTDFSFEELSPVLVEQINSLSNFCAKTKVKSLMVPFACLTCKKETLMAIDIPTLKENPNPGAVYCKHCHGQAEFDDLPEEYFACLEILE